MDMMQIPAPGATIEQMIPTSVRDKFDVLVCGGGTAGCVAALAAARAGARTLLVERHGYLGGMMTAGNAGLTKYIKHDKSQTAYRDILDRLAVDPQAVQVVGGLPMAITQRLIDSGAGLGTAGKAGSYVFTSQQDFKYMLLEMLQSAGVHFLLHSQVVDVWRQGERIAGVVVENKSGRQAWLAGMVIDATGDGDVAWRAGVPYVLGVGPDDMAFQQGVPAGTMQHMGVMFRVANIDIDPFLEYLAAFPDRFAIQPFGLMDYAQVRQAYRRNEMAVFCVNNVPEAGFQIYNTPIPGIFTFCCPTYAGNGTDVDDLTQAELFMASEVARRMHGLKQLPGFAAAVLLDVPEICVRETRHIQGEYVLNIQDILGDRSFPDSIGRGCHPIDIQPIPPELRQYPLRDWSFAIPYRSLVARGIDNLLLAGRCISCTHEASGCTRVTAQCMITGEAAGTAAALSLDRGCPARDLPLVLLQNKLRQNGVIL